ncbi:hypothetical protein C9427_11995 [Mesorhizobium helmanticense]|uniref:Uncharacterized protein n=1 Tax=Mesorhizobium helmanticense TaxID=1776423 RepID=A0A2T4IXA6_9HYPH|nr:hypothetical protein C9427_11995 [Mesorhizobium helmanticense]
MCQPGPHRQPTVSTGIWAAPGLATGIACEPVLDNIRVPAARAMGRMCLVSMTVFSMVHTPGE